MAYTATDWTIDRATGDIRYIGDDHGGTAPSYATVIEAHRAWQDFADDLTSSGDDELDITDTNPSSRSTDNIIRLLGTYNIDDTAAEHLYDGSILQGTGDTETFYDGVVNFGNPIVQIQILQDGAILADDWWNKNVGGTHDGSNNVAILTDSGESWTTDEWVGYTIYNTTDNSSGIITANTATTITATLAGGTDDDWDTSDSYLIGQGLNADSAQGISHRFMIKTRDNGVDIDGRRLIGTSRRFGKTYSEFSINGTSRGNNVLALSDADDLNNTTAYATVEGWSGITNTSEGLSLIDVDNNGSDEEYYSEWNVNTPTRTINDFYERLKWLSRDGSGSTLYSLNGEVFRGITHSFAYDGETGTAPADPETRAWGLLVTYDNEATGPFTVGEVLQFGTSNARGRLLDLDDNGAIGTMVVAIESGTPADNNTITGVTSGATADVNGAPSGAATGGGTMQLLAVDDDGTTGNLYIQVLKGTAPADNDRVYLSGDHTAYVDVNGSVTSRTISTPFVGQSTGSALIGSYGLGVQTDDLTNSDTLFDLSNTAVNPPNNVTFSVNGLVSAEDTVHVAPWDGSTLDVNGNPEINYNQLDLDASLTTDNITSVVVGAGDEGPSIPSDTPSTGYIRVEDDNGFYRRLHYSSWTGSTFTIDTTDGQEDFATVNATAANNVYISYLDIVATGATESFTGVYASDRNLVVIVRDGGGSPIKEFISSATLGSTGGSITAIRTTDE